MNIQNHSPITLHIVPRDLARFVAGLSALVLILGYLRFGQLLFGVPVEALRVHWLDFDNELSIPAWYSSLLLTGTGIIMFWTHATEHRLRTRTALGWFILGAGFIYLSLDEMASIHEYFSRISDHIPFDADIFTFRWVIIGLAIIVTVGTAFLPFVLRLPRPTARRLILAGITYVGGAVGMELVGGYVFANFGPHSFGYLASTSLEETLEIIGATLAFRAVLLHLAETLRAGTLYLTPDQPGRAPPSSPQ